MSGWHGAYVHRARAYLAPMLPCVCWRCGNTITPDMTWDVGHIIGRDIDPTLIHDPTNWAPEHTYCSRSAGARYGNAKRRRRRTPPTSRQW